MKKVILLLTLISTSAFAQSAEQTATLQKAVAVLQQQRNEALDAAADFRIKLATSNEEVVKLKAELEEIKKKAKD